MHRYEISGIIKCLVYHRRAGAFRRGAPDNLGRPFPLLSPFNVVRPPQIFKKKSYAEGSEGNDTLFQTIFTVICKVRNVLRYSFVVIPLVSFDTSPSDWSLSRFL